MPLFKFLCKCGKEKRLLLPRAKDARGLSPPCECGEKMFAVYGAVQSNEYTVADEDRNKKHLVGVTKMLEERSNEHHRKHQLPRIIAEHGEEYAKDNNLIDEDGRSKT
jgi:hypothetical protein